MELRYLKDLWNDAETAGMDEPEQLLPGAVQTGSALHAHWARAPDCTQLWRVPQVPVESH